MLSEDNQRNMYYHAAPEALVATIISNLAKVDALMDQVSWAANTLRMRLSQIRNDEWPVRENNE